jgi:hypothetical protein
MPLWSCIDSLRADTVFGWRQLRKRKVTSAAAIVSLALAIGACTSAFRLIDALLLRPLPIAHPGRLYSCFHQSFLSAGKPMTLDGYEYPMFREMRAMVKDQAELIAVSYAERTDLTYGTDREIEKAYLQYVSGWMFSTFGLRPALGGCSAKMTTSRRARIPTRSFPTTIGGVGSARIRKCSAAHSEWVTACTRS